jgi:hypothetical protein
LRRSDNALPSVAEALLILRVHRTAAEHARMRPLPATTLFVLFFSIGTCSAQQLQCSPCSYVFASTQVGSSSTYSFQLENIGTSVLKITSLSAPGAPFSFGSVKLPASIQPGKSMSLPVIFAPTSAGNYLSDFTIVSTGKNPMQGGQLVGSGIGAAAQLSVSPSTLNFGNVNVGATASLAATLTATNGAVTISAAESSTSEFAVTGLSLPLTIAAGKSVQATVNFTPNASGTASAQDQFVSNATNSPTREQLTGTGVAQSSSHSASLSWQAGATGIVGYNVYRGTGSGGPYSQINSALVASTSYTDTTVAAGTTYYYVTTEINNAGQESGYSNVAEAKIP